MNRLFAVSLSMFAFGLGCVVAHFVVPPLRAGTNPTRWEYFCMGDEPDKFNQLGVEGWELQAGIVYTSQIMDRGVWCFKRPRP
jgi:hypothetical protein